MILNVQLAINIGNFVIPISEIEDFGNFVIPISNIKDFGNFVIPISLIVERPISNINSYL